MLGGINVKVHSPILKRPEGPKNGEEKKEPKKAQN